MAAPLAASVPLIAVSAVAAGVWIGGLVAIFVVARVASATLDQAQRISFFRALGRTYGIVGGVALLVALAGGALLLADHPWEGLLIASAIVAGALVAATVAGIAQARAMTRLRRRALSGPTLLREQVRRGGIIAAALRGAIAILTLTLVVLGSALVA
jgi:hypothetical protein